MIVGKGEVLGLPRNCGARGVGCEVVRHERQAVSFSLNYGCEPDTRLSGTGMGWALYVA
jgi:hypothetical protein